MIDFSISGLGGITDLTGNISVNHLCQCWHKNKRPMSVHSTTPVFLSFYSSIKFLLYFDAFVLQSHVQYCSILSVLSICQLSFSSISDCRKQRYEPWYPCSFSQWWLFPSVRQNSCKCWLLLLPVQKINSGIYPIYSH